MRIELTSEELMIGALEGVMRHVRSLKENRAGVNQQPQHLQWQVKIEGALAEIAVAKALGVYWSGACSRGSSDAGDYEVRMTRYAKGSLFLHKHDEDDKKYILVCGLNGKYDVVGWIWGSEGKKEDYWQKVSEDRDPAYFVPQDVLIPMQDLMIGELIG